VARRRCPYERWQGAQDGTASWPGQLQLLLALLMLQCGATGRITVSITAGRGMYGDSTLAAAPAPLLSLLPLCRCASAECW